MKNIKRLKLFLPLAWGVSRLYVLTLVFSALISGVQVVCNVTLPKFLIDELAGTRELSRIVIFISLIVGSNLLFALVNNLIKRYTDAKSTYMSEMLQQRLSEKIMNVEYACLETPKYLDLKERAAFAIRNQSALLALIQQTAEALKNIITLAGLLAVTLSLNPVFIALLTVMMCVGVYRQFRFTKTQYQVMQSIIPVNRKYGYYLNLMNNNGVHKDLRLYNMTDMLADRVVDYNVQIHNQFEPFYTKTGRFLGSQSILNDAQAALAYAYTGMRVLTDTWGPRLSLGSFSMYVNATLNFTKASSSLGRGLVNLMQALNYLEPYAEFMSLPDEGDTGGDVLMDDAIDSIRFENVSFSYPGSDKLVMDGVSFDISKGEKISIVGLNGAGKTTLVKLLCRFYKPNSGRILINGRDIWEYEHKSYIRHITAVFQDYKLFAFSVEENITGSKAKNDQDTVRRIIEQVGLDNKINSLENGVGTMLGKAYDENGTEFSGGESQKIAIARALYKNSPLIILDEPTSALDPLAEAEIYENFNTLVGDKTAIYISHRMSSSVFCDRILLIDGGSVCDYDTHANLLLKTDSLYYKLFMSQAENYKIEREYNELGAVI